MRGEPLTIRASDSSDSQTVPELSIDLEFDLAGGPALDTDWLAQKLTQLAGQLNLSSGQISITIVDEGRMAELAGQYRGEFHPTDVLSFDLRDDSAAADPSCIDADLVLCLDVARRQAAHRDHPVRTEVLLYALHGLLHLVGEDDHDPAGYQAMHQREDRLLEAIGVGPVFFSKRFSSGSSSNGD